MGAIINISSWTPAAASSICKLVLPLLLARALHEVVRCRQIQQTQMQKRPTLTCKIWLIAGELTCMADGRHCCSFLLCCPASQNMHYPQDHHPASMRAA